MKKIETEVAGMTMLKVSSLSPSTYNPRVTFDENELQSLADSIKAKGVLEPILARPIAGGRYEIVAGERRFRAVKLAGLTSIPAVVRSLNDQEAAEIAIIENAQRANLTPIEEGRGIQTLIDRFGYQAEDAAARMGLSAKTVHQRLALLMLPKDALDAIEAGRLPLGSAVQLARIPDQKIRAEASKACLAGNYHSQFEPLGPKATTELIRRNFQTELSAATFPVNDADLLPSAGSCGTCRHRSGNQKELFPGKKESNLCLNTACFAAKNDAYTKRILAEAKAKGAEVIAGKESKQLFAFGNRLNYNAPYVEASDKWQDYSSTKKPVAYQKLVGKTVEPVYAVDPSGVVRTLYPKAEVNSALKSLGLIQPQTHSDTTRPAKSEAEKRREREVKADRLAIVEALQLARVSVKAVVPKFTTPDQRIIWKALAAGYLGRIWDETLKLFCLVMEIKVEKSNHTNGMAEAVSKWLSEASDEDAYIACFILSLIRLSNSSEINRKQMLAAYDALGIDFGEIRLAHLRSLIEKTDKSKAKAKPAKEKKSQQAEVTA